MDDPRTRLILLLLIGLWAVILDRPASLGILCAVSAMPFLMLPIGWTWRRRGLLAAVGVVWTTALSQGLFYGDLPRVPLIGLGPLTIYQEGLTYGLVQSLRMVSVSFAGVAVAIAPPPDRLFAALMRLGVPYSIAFLSVTALRFVPQAGHDLLMVRRARRRRGRPVGARAPWAWLILEIAMLRPVVARSLRRAHRMAESLDTRGFDPMAPRAIRRPLRMRVAEVWFLGFCTMATGLLCTVEVFYWLYLNEVLYLPWWRPLYGFVRTWL
ncbi:MAG: energy-coupling factor transporter transmembrane protein EcfT [Proteobacteria bacterium]|nr:energy-coupling factor transporter transmembrane protein EcfT [Pseudomonadota bacterium]